ncbi:MAG TPA: diguanylate cyclase [Vicinamibacteria bacterium]|nr:diguanylate cyclase [Vicinamibacteria bacterium]
MADPRPRADPVLDSRWRRRAGRVLLDLAAVLAGVALLRPLSTEGPWWLQGAYVLLLAIAVTASASLCGLGGRGRPVALALQACLVLSVDALAQLAAPAGWPSWPLMSLLIASQAVAEGLPVALAFAGLATLLTASAPRWAPPFDLHATLAAAVGYLAIALAVNRALAGEKRRLSATLAELARLTHGIDQLEDEASQSSRQVSREAEALRLVSGEGRRARQLDRASELEEWLRRLVEVAQAAVEAHAVLYFDLDRERELAHLRVARGPEALVPECAVPLGADPFSFLVEREQPFYATDFRRLLWELPWYRGQVKVGSLLATPVCAGGKAIGALVAERLEIQSFTGREPALLQGFAALAGEAVQRTRASLGREELGAEFREVYPISQKLATLSLEEDVCGLLLAAARQVAGPEGAAVVMTDERRTRYEIAAASGWPHEYLAREVGLHERTWAAWVLHSAEQPVLLGHLAGEKQRMPVFVLDEGAARAGSLLAVRLRAHNRALGALVLTGPKAAFDDSSRRVLEILANQAAATLWLIRERERQRQLAVRDALTGLHNRRAFDEHLVAAIANEDRRQGQLGLVMLDLDHFKKLNDTYGHPAGDEALHSVARLLDQHLRKGDYAARYGGEEFVLILPGADEEHAMQAAERLRRALQKCRFLHDGDRIPLSASFGVAVWPGDGREAEALLASADRSLYAAKQTGRNRVVPASRLPAESPTGAP